jgi:hypothetical protein
MVEAQLRKRFGAIEWDRPVEVRTPTDWGYACRYCIALKGLKAADVSSLPKDPNAVRRHIRERHA